MSNTLLIPVCACVHYGFGYEVDYEGAASSYAAPQRNLGPRESWDTCGPANGRGNIDSVSVPHRNRRRRRGIYDD